MLSHVMLVSRLHVLLMCCVVLKGACLFRSHCEDRFLIVSIEIGCWWILCFLCFREVGGRSVLLLECIVLLAGLCCWRRRVFVQSTVFCRHRVPGLGSLEACFEGWEGRGNPCNYLGSIAGPAV